MKISVMRGVLKASCLIRATMLLSLSRWNDALMLTICGLQIDSTTNIVLQQRFGVEAYPSLYFLKDGETRECFETRTLAKVRNRSKRIIYTLRI